MLHNIIQSYIPRTLVSVTKGWSHLPLRIVYNPWSFKTIYVLIMVTIKLRKDFVGVSVSVSIFVSIVILLFIHVKYRSLILQRGCLLY